MNKNQQLLSFFSYICGFIALITVLVDNKEDKLYSFHTRQALIFNLTIGVITAITYGVFLPNYILSLQAGERTLSFLLTTSIPILAIIILSLILGIFAYKEKKFKIPIIGKITEKTI